MRAHVERLLISNLTDSGGRASASTHLLPIEALYRFRTSELCLSTPAKGRSGRVGKSKASSPTLLQSGLAQARIHLQLRLALAMTRGRAGQRGLPVHRRSSKPRNSALRVCPQSSSLIAVSAHAGHLRGGPNWSGSAPPSRLLRWSATTSTQRVDPILFPSCAESPSYSRED
jgi:hypothetical protein